MDLTPSPETLQFSWPIDKLFDYLVLKRTRNIRMFVRC